MDAFSQILSSVVLKGALFFNAEFSAPWGFMAPTGQELAPLLAPDAPHLLIYHFLVEGSGIVRLGNDAPVSRELAGTGGRLAGRRA
jgi:Cupin